MATGPLAVGQQSFGPSRFCLLQLPPTPVTPRGQADSDRPPTLGLNIVSLVAKQAQLQLQG